MASRKNELDVASRLDQIATNWDRVVQAHSGDTSDERQARFDLVNRYRRAIFRYVLSIVRSVDVAEELCQDMAIKFLQGDFRHADPDAGRFRDYVRTSVINLTRKYFRMRDAQPGRMLEEPPASQDESVVEADVFAAQWRRELLDQAWNALRTANPAYHDLLRLRVANTAMTSRELAEEFTSTCGKPMTAVNVRKILERAHTRFADLLVREVATSLVSDDCDIVRSELQELDLLKFCRLACERWCQSRDR